MRPLYNGQHDYYVAGSSAAVTRQAAAWPWPREGHQCDGNTTQHSARHSGDTAMVCFFFHASGAVSRSHIPIPTLLTPWGRSQRQHDDEGDHGASTSSTAAARRAARLRHSRQRCRCVTTSGSVTAAAQRAAARQGHTAHSGTTCSPATMTRYAGAHRGTTRSLAIATRHATAHRGMTMQPCHGDPMRSSPLQHHLEFS